MTEENLIVRDDVRREDAPPISLHLMVKNGASVVGRLLDQVGPYLSSASVVCNDCDDDTWRVLRAGMRRHGVLDYDCAAVTSRHYPELYFPDVPDSYRVGRPLAGEVFPDSTCTGRPLLANWAAARNVAWLQSRGAWRLFLDADDSVDGPSLLPGLVRALDERGVDVSSSCYHAGGAGSRGGVRERLARNLPQIAWVGLVHERLVGYDPRKTAHVEGSLVVRDLRDSSGGGLRPPLRNLKVLYRQARLLDWELGDRDSLYLAAEAAAAAVMPTLTRRLALTCYERSPLPQHRAWAALLLAESSGLLESEMWYRRSADAWPTLAAAEGLAEVFAELGDWSAVLDEAVPISERAASSPQSYVSHRQVNFDRLVTEARERLGR